jgi:hypothetical protein
MYYGRVLICSLSAKIVRYLNGLTEMLILRKFFDLQSVRKAQFGRRMEIIAHPWSKQFSVCKVYPN